MLKEYCRKNEFDMELKLGDFGLSSKINTAGYLIHKCGTPGFIAPEILAGYSYNEKVDIYSCGIVLNLLYFLILKYRLKRYHNLNRYDKDIILKKSQTADFESKNNWNLEITPECN